MRKILLIFPVMAFILLPFIVHAQCVQPPTSMVSWWMGDGDANDLAGGNNGTLMNELTFAAGMVSQAFSLDGVDDYVNIPNAASLNPTSAITVDAWFYTTDITGQTHPPLVKKADMNAGYALEINYQDSNIRFWVVVNGVWQVSAAVPVSINTWYHVAGTYDGSSIRIYLDGQPQGSPTNVAGTITPASNPLNIGRDPANTNRFFQGLIDEVEIFGRALTAEEILAIYNAGRDGKCKVSVTGPCYCYAITCTNLDSGMVIADHPVVLCFDRESNTGFFNGLCNASGDMSLFFDAMNKEALAYSEDNPYGYLKFHGDWLHAVTGIGYCAESKWEMRGLKVDEECCPPELWPYR